MRQETVLIIGGGLGGLFTGAILAKEGFQVTILEKNSTIGGGLQTFNRFGMTFDTGMHVVGGMQQGGNIRRICQYLGIDDKVDLLDVDRECSDRLFFNEDNAIYDIPKGRTNFIKKLSEYFPLEHDGLTNYVEAIYRIADSVDLFNLRPSEDFFKSYPSNFLMAANEFIAKYIKDRRLRSVLAYMNPLYGGRRNETPAFIHAIINVLYVKGTSRFVDGSDKFANLLAGVINDNGGTIIVNDPVEWLDVVNRQVESVRTKSGRAFSADYYISDIHPCTLMSLMPSDAFPKSYRNRLNEIPNSYSSFGVYIKLKKDSFPYINHSEYYMEDYDDIWDCGLSDDKWPRGFLFMTPPDSNQGPFASKILVTAPMSFEYVRQWENTTVGRRGDDYKFWKQQKAESIIRLIDKIHPGFINCIEDMNTSSPLTIRDFYGVKEGALSGFSKDCNNITLSQVPVITKVRNLFLTGQNNNLHGFCGVPLTAITTCEALLGRNYIINKINECVEA